MSAIRRATRKHQPTADKIRIFFEGLRGEESIAALCRRDAIAWRLCSGMAAGDISKTLELTMIAAGYRNMPLRQGTSHLAEAPAHHA